MNQVDFGQAITDERFLFLRTVSSSKFLLSSYVTPTSSGDVAFSLHP